MLRVSGHEFESQDVKEAKSNEPSAKDQKVIAKEDDEEEENKKKKSEFAKVSEDMSELVFHLNTIQNDISELAGRPISIVENNSC